ncbi:hypothetical protein [Photorhabdus caribbeanensis]|uniref:hypothetical protein n=1 Tax=Photorhabdus caribbeanensis TaxID=1004165 RepID=UPI001BD27ABB|nr:hypothetical protein [Photorhabdus caribbeanensis]
MCQVPVETIRKIETTRKYHLLRLMASGELANFTVQVIGHSAKPVAATQPNAHTQADMCSSTLPMWIMSATEPTRLQ